MEEIARSLPITEGLERMMTILKRVGYKTAILSGGFTYFGNYLRQRYGFDYVYANELEIENGQMCIRDRPRSWPARCGCSRPRPRRSSGCSPRARQA